VHSDNCPRIIENNYAKIVASLLVVYLLLASFYILLGSINEDEGWYLYASKLVYEGRVLYSDFSYTQGPLLPYVYGIPQLVFGTSLYLGRITSLLLALMTLLLSTAISNRLAGKLAGAICGAAMSLNLFSIYFLTITKTYSLTALLLSASVFCLVSTTGKWLRYSLSAMFLCLAGATRLSAISAIPILFLYLLVFEPEDRRYLLLAAAASIVTTAAAFLPFCLRDLGLLWYNLIGFHMAPYGTSDVLHVMRYKIQTLLSIARFFYFMVVSLVSGVVLFLVHGRRRMRKALANHGIHIYLVGILAVMFLSHFLPGGSYAEYQVMNVPLMAILAGCVYSKCYEKSGTPKGKNLVLGVICASLLTDSIIGHETGHIDLSGSRLPIDEISVIADYVSEYVGEDEPIFTYHTYLAIQSGRSVLPGLEMAIFSYYPEWDTQTAHKYRVTNNEIAKKLVGSQEAAAVILTDFDFRHSASHVPLDEEEQERNRNEILTQVQRYYHLAKEMDSFGQWRDTAYVYLRREE